MQLTREKIKFKGKDIKLKINLSNNYNESGISQSIGEYVEENKVSAINEISDAERFKYTNSNIPNLDYNFFFYSVGDDAYQSDYTFAGIGVQEILNFRAAFINSFFIIQYYDTRKIENQNLIHTSYINGFDFVSGSTSTFTNVKSNVVFNQLYIPESFVKDKPNIISLYARYYFYNAQTGTLKIFKNQDKPNSVIEDVLYVDVDINKSTKTWSAVNGSTLNLIEIPPSDYTTKINNSLNSIEERKPEFPVGERFNNDGTYNSI